MLADPVELLQPPKHIKINTITKNAILLIEEIIAVINRQHKEITWDAEIEYNRPVCHPKRQFLSLEI